MFSCARIFRVAFGPSAVAIEGNRAVLEGSLIKLQCNPVGTNPKSAIQWTPPDYLELPEHAQCPIGIICNHLDGRMEVCDKFLTVFMVFGSFVVGT